MVRSGEAPEDSIAVMSRQALMGRLAQVKEQFRATSDILKVLTSSSGDPDKVFDAVVENARTLLNAAVAQIYLVKGATYVIARQSGMSEEHRRLLEEHPIKRDRGTLVGRVTIDRRIHHITDALADPEYNRSDLQRMAGFRSMIGAPLIVGDEVVGALNVMRNRVAPFDDVDERVLATFAEQAALALRHVDLFAALESRSAALENRSAELARKVEQLEGLADVGAAISSTLVPDEMLATIVSHAVELSRTDGGSLMEFDDATGLFGVRTVYGTSDDTVAALRAAEIHIDRTWVGKAARTRRVLQIPDLDEARLDEHLAVLHADGWKSLVAVPLASPDRVVGVLVVRRKRTGSFSGETCDLLDTFASQSAVALTNARLYQQLELQSADLAEASRHKSEFLASMSHELRTPLNAVIGFSEVLLERMFGELNERQEDYLKDIHAAGRHLLAVLGDILDLSKIEAGRMELDLATFPVDDVIGQALSLVRERAALHGIELTLEAQEGLGLVTADELRLKQVLLNLLSNAVKFTPDGGSVEVRARRDAGDLVVTVTDTGIGIAPEDQDRIFDSFQQGSRSASTTEGTGLGLTLSKQIVELHGGTMWVRSTLGEGSTFGLRIPQAGRAEAREERWTVDDAAGPGPTVVVIEDDPRSAELVALHLRAAGLDPVTVGTGEAGLEAVRRLSPAAVVLDIHLPGMTGWDVLETLKGDASTAAVPVVVVSVEPERGRGFALGATEYLVKPVAGEHLLAAVSRALQHTRTPVAGGTLPEGRSVVVVDDDPLALKLVRSTLEPLRWTVHTCSGGHDAADLVRTVNPSVVIMDLLMPGVDGFAVIDELWADGTTGGPPIVVLTAKSLTAEDLRRLEGRIAFVAEKAGLDLASLAQRLAQVAAAGDAQAAPEVPEPGSGSAQD
jgi:signal transduction histidine kinase/CheY-like chemotaxis protein